MPAVQEFPRFTNPHALRAGLVLQAKPEIDCNEYGMEQGTLKFLTFTENLKRLTPERGTPCSQFKAGDDLTARILRQLDYIGAQTNGKILDGDCPGVGILEVLCQGAIFAGHSGDIRGIITPASTDDPITIPHDPADSTLDTVTVPIFSAATAGADAGSPPGGTITAIINYHSIDLHFEYMARDKAQQPRFLRTSYDLSPETGFLIIDEDGTELKLLIDAVAIQQSGTIVAPSDPLAAWLTKVTYAGTGAAFRQSRSGQFWHVIETTSIKIVPTDQWSGKSVTGAGGDDVIVGGGGGGDVG